MSHSLYPNQYGLSSDEDCLLEEVEDQEEATHRRPGNKARTRSAYAPPSLSRSWVSETMRSRSKYDHRPRNMEFDGKKFVATHRRSSGSEVRERGSTDTVEARAVSFELPVEGTGHRAEVEEWGDIGEVWWFGVGKMELWQVIALGCVMGLLLGILYRGGLGGLYLGLSPRGKYTYTVECVTYV